MFQKGANGNGKILGAALHFEKHYRIIRNERILRKWRENIAQKGSGSNGKFIKYRHDKTNFNKAWIYLLEGAGAKFSNQSDRLPQNGRNGKCAAGLGHD